MVLGMYESFYKLRDEPFRLSPDPNYCYRHRSYVKAEGYLRYGMERAEGMVMVTGVPGTGKSTLIVDLLRDFPPSKVLTGILVITRLDTDNLFRAVAYAFNLTVEGMDRASVLRTLELFLTEQAQKGKRALLIVDEAQNLTHEGLEDLRLLTNLQMGNRPLLQVFLLGQESLREKVQDKTLKQLLQRIIAACHLDPLEADETHDYIEERLTQAGWQGNPSITDEAFALIHKYSGGIPRRINQICSRLLLYGSVDEKYVLNESDVHIVLEDFRKELLVPADERSQLEELARGWARGAYQRRVVNAPGRPTGAPIGDRPRGATGSSRVIADRQNRSAHANLSGAEAHPPNRDKTAVKDTLENVPGPRLQTVSKGSVNETLRALAAEDDPSITAIRAPRDIPAPQGASRLETTESGPPAAVDAGKQPSLYADARDIRKRRGGSLRIERYEEEEADQGYDDGAPGGRSWLTLLLAVALLLTSIYAVNPLLRDQFGIDILAVVQDKLSALAGVESLTQPTENSATQLREQLEQQTPSKSSSANGDTASKTPLGSD
jgi:putative secretion ATPase (PEP-CTERM system associated)